MASCQPRRQRLWLATLAGQERIYDSDTFNSWLTAKLGNEEKAAEFFERRFRDEYRPAFRAWMKTYPFNNAQAPPGLTFLDSRSSSWWVVDPANATQL